MRTESTRISARCHTAQTLLLIICCFAGCEAGFGCAAGSYWTSFTNCSPCPAGSYCAGSATYFKSVTACPAGTFNPLASASSVAACLNCSAGFYSSKGAATCAGCRAGTYQPAVRSSSCNLCAAGTYGSVANATSASVCLTCGIGQYSTAGSGSCSPCPEGTFNPLPSQGTCSSCPGGTFSNATGQVSNATCQLCPVATYSAGGAATCTLCPAGRYNDATGVANCPSCPVGTYSLQGSLTCLACDTGTYAPTPGMATCTNCPAGSYNPTTGSSSSTSCILCPISTYNPTPGSSNASACVPCPVGKYGATAGLETCRKCSAGTFNQLTGMNSSSSCLPCPAGNFSISGSSACPPCAAGSYSESPGTATCSLCSAGTAGNATGSTSPAPCSPCPIGTYSPPGSSSCLACASGSYNNVTQSGSCALCPAGTASNASGSISIVSCTNCSKGSFSSPGSATCTLCRPGSFGLTTGAGACSLCPGGTFSTATGATSSLTCSLCGMGTYSSNGSSACAPCPSGSYGDKTGSPQCTLCPAGTKNSGTGSNSSSSCTSCPPGSFSNSGSSACTLCRAGTYSTAAGSPTCTNCSAGWYSSAVGSNTSSTCLMCDPGESSPPGSSSCITCPAGSYSTSSASASCVLCPAGFYNPNAASNSSLSCLQCPKGAYSALNGSASCTPCAAGSYSDRNATINCTMCAAGYYSPATGANSSSTCVICSSGSFSASGSRSCTNCPAGTYSAAAGSMSCAACPPGSSNPLSGQNSQSSCKSCSPGSIAPNASSPACTLCPAGSMCGSPGGVVCTNCSAGSYSPTPGWNTTCLACPAGMYNSQMGSGSCALCPAGFYGQQQTGSASCLACPAGRYSATPGLANISGCANCSVGSFNPMNGSTSLSACMLCPVNFYGPAVGLSSCTACPAGNVTVGTGSRLVTDCARPKICSLANVTFRNVSPSYMFDSGCFSISFTNVSILDNSTLNLTVADMTASKPARGPFQMSLVISNSIVGSGGTIVLEGGAASNLTSLTVILANLMSSNGGLLLHGSFPPRTSIVVTNLSSMLNATSAPVFTLIGTTVYVCVVLSNVTITTSSSLVIRGSSFSSNLNNSVTFLVSGVLIIAHQSSLNIVNSSLAALAVMSTSFTSQSVNVTIADYSDYVLQNVSCTVQAVHSCLLFQFSPMLITGSSSWRLVSSNASSISMISSPISLVSSSVWEVRNSILSSVSLPPVSLDGASNVILSNGSAFVISDTVLFTKPVSGMTPAAMPGLAFNFLNCSDSMSWIGILRNNITYTPTDTLQPFSAIAVRLGVFVAGYVSVAGMNCFVGSTRTTSVFNGSVSVVTAGGAAFVEKCNTINGTVSDAGFPSSVTKLSSTFCGACDAAVDCFQTLTNKASSCPNSTMAPSPSPSTNLTTNMMCSCLPGGQGLRCLPVTAVAPARPHTNSTSTTISISRGTDEVSVTKYFPSRSASGPTMTFNESRSFSPNATESIVIFNIQQMRTPTRTTLTTTTTLSRQLSHTAVGREHRTPSGTFLFARRKTAEPVKTHEKVTRTMESSSVSLSWELTSSSSLARKWITHSRSRSHTVIPPPPPPTPAPKIVSAAVSNLASASVAAGVASATVAGPDSASDMQAIVLVALAECAVGSAGASGQYQMVTPFALEDSAVGALGGNFVAFSSLAALQLLCSVCYSKVKRRTFRQATAKMRFPGFVVLLMASMHQSTLFASLRLFTQHHSAGEVLFGFVGFVLSILVPLGAGAACLKYPRRFIEYGYPDGSAYIKPWSMLVRPVGVTRPRHVGRYLSSLVTRYAIPALWCVLLPFASSIAVNLVAVLPASSPTWLCSGVIFLSAAVHLAIAAVMVILRPHRVALNWVVCACGLIITAVLHAQIGSNIRAGIEHTITAQAGLSLARSVLSVAAMLLEWRVSLDKSVDQAKVRWIVGDGGGDDPTEDVSTAAASDAEACEMTGFATVGKVESSGLESVAVPLLQQEDCDEREVIPKSSTDDDDFFAAPPAAGAAEDRASVVSDTLGRSEKSIDLAAASESEIVAAGSNKRRQNMFGEDAVSATSATSSFCLDAAVGARANPLEHMSQLYREIDEAARFNVL